MFLQRDRENIARRSAEPKSIRFADGTPAPCFRHLQTILAKAAARKQEVFVATYPYHARLLEIIVALDLWPAYEDWKIELVRTVDSARQQGARVTLRDFGGFHSYAQDKLPLDGSRAPAPEWYWESGHFKSALGNRMLAAIFQNGVPQGSFGVELTGANVAKHLGLVRDEKQEFESRDSAVAAEIRQLVAVRAGRPSVASRAGPSPRDMPPAAPVLPGSPE
jgi:hypothetical protein